MAKSATDSFSARYRRSVSSDGDRGCFSGWAATPTLLVVRGYLRRPDASLSVSREIRGGNGVTHIVMEQSINGLPVYGAYVKAAVGGPIGGADSGLRGRSWVSMGDPVGSATSRADLAWKFRELCDQHDGLPRAELYGAVEDKGALPFRVVASPLPGYLYDPARHVLDWTYASCPTLAGVRRTVPVYAEPCARFLQRAAQVYQREPLTITAAPVGSVTSSASCGGCARIARARWTSTRSAGAS